MAAFRRSFAEYGFVVLTVMIGVALTLWICAARQKSAEYEQIEAFHIAANDRINVIQNAVQRNIFTSHSVVSLYQASNDVSRDEFALFVAQMLTEQSSIEAMEWAPRVEASEQAQVEALAKETVPDFAFKDIGEDGTLIPSTRRDTYFPILYIEPLANYTARVFGVDFMTQPAHRKAMEQAIESNQTAASSRITLLSSGNPGVLFFSPVFKNTILQGFLVTAVPLNDITPHAIEPLNKEGVNIIAHDVTDEAAPELLFVHASRLKPAGEAEILEQYRNSTLRHEGSFDVAGRKWQITVVPAEGYFTHANKLPLPILLSGFGFTALLAYFMVSRIRENTRIKAIVKQRTYELEQLARRDPLTGLANRRLFMELLQQTLSRAARMNTKVGVIYLDLNGFKSVNDTMGHAAGDELLVALGGRLSIGLREYDTLARLGGDEFALLADNVQGAQDCVMIAERMIEAIQHPFVIMGKEVNIGASIGIAVFPEHASTLDSLLAHADSAMYQAKSDKTKPYIIYYKSLS